MSAYGAVADWTWPSRWETSSATNSNGVGLGLGKFACQINDPVAGLRPDCG